MPVVIFGWSTNYYPVHPIFYDREQAIMRYDSGSNLFNLSSLREYYHPVNSAGFAIKFVVAGAEHYKINRQDFSICSGSYLLLNGSKDAKVTIESKSNVKGICINISNEVIADVVSSFVRPDTVIADPQLASFFYTDHFLENQYSALSTRLGSKLLAISREINSNGFSEADINTGLFLTLAESLVADQVTIFKQLQSVPALKPETRRDLLRRIIRGREFIDTCFMSSLSISGIAKEAAMSEFHFFRLFKKIYRASPYQYIINKRLQAAGELMKAGGSITEAAIACGFGDIHTFSKAYKKRYGLSPSYGRSRNSRIEQNTIHNDC